MTIPWDDSRPHGPGGRTGPLDQPYAPAPPGSVPPPIPTYVPPADPYSYGYGYGAVDDRRPAPPPQPPTTLRYADWGERVGATLVDWVVMWAPVVFLTTVAPAESSLPGFVWLVLAGYVAWLNGSKGQSPGKALMGIKLVREADGSTLGGPVGLVRSIVLALMGVVTGGLLWLLAVLWPLWNPRHRALHDMIFSAAVVAGQPRARIGKELFLP